MIEQNTLILLGLVNVLCSSFAIYTVCNYKKKTKNLFDLLRFVIILDRKKRDRNIFNVLQDSGITKMTEYFQYDFAIKQVDEVDE